MNKKITPNEIAALAQRNGYTFAQLMALIEVESSGIGFSEKTGRIIIQFEPNWFKIEYKDWKAHQGTWINNGVSDQTKEWIAFDNAFAIDPDAAMESTSIGMMQVMGFHWKELGFETVGAMWDFAKESEANQVEIAIKFIKLNPKLDKALKNKDWPTVAYYYNGSGYKKFNYDHRLLAAFIKHSQKQNLS
ncbi:MAG: N-acetylmuramidase family protein [Bacteroidota bacterium]|nr:N-acetylmuramidase family protein [Bacteroidota bacterium]